MPDAIRLRYELAVDWDGNGTWEEDELIRDDLQHIRCQYGRESRDSLKGKSIGGYCEVLLKNESRAYSVFNQAGPYYGDISTGRAVQVRAYVEDTQHVLWTGFLTDILPHVGTEEAPYAQLNAVGSLSWIDQAFYEIFVNIDTIYQADPAGLEVTDQYYSGVLVALMLDQIGWKGREQFLDAPADVKGPYGREGTYRALAYTRATLLEVPGPFGRQIDLGSAIIDANALLTDGELGGGEAGSRVRAIRTMRALEEAEVGFLRESKDGSIVYEDRYKRLRHVGLGPIFSDDIDDERDYPFPYDPFDLGSYEEGIYNVIRSDQTQYFYGTESHIFEAIPGPTSRGGPQEPLEIPAGETVEYTWSLPPVTVGGRKSSLGTTAGTPSYVWPWKDVVVAPPGTSNNAAGLQDPESDEGGLLQWDLNADFTAGSLHGNANRYVSVRTFQSARSIKLQITNSFTRSVYINKLRFRGFPHFIDKVIRTSATNEESIRKYQIIREYKAVTGLLWKRRFPLDYLQALARIYGEARPNGTLTVRPRQSLRMATECLGLEISDSIQVRNAQYGLFGGFENQGQPFFIENIAHDIERGGEHVMKLELSSLETTGLWILGESELGVTTTLGF